ncbi:MAG: FAD binding domain-containing protein [Actinomycetota bacterium]
MPSVLAYHRPESLKEAIELASQPDTLVIGGGTKAVPTTLKQRGNGVQIVDLQALNLVDISFLDEARKKQIIIGSMVRLSEIEEETELPDALRKLARRELPSALRNQATVGGTVASANPESVLLAGLLAYAAEIEINGETWVNLEEVLQNPAPSGIITSLRITIDEESAQTSFHSVCRTPMDTPIVSATAIKIKDQTRVVLTGVGETPVLLHKKKDLENLDPKEDFRGTRTYRLHLASVLYERVVMEVNQ